MLQLFVIGTVMGFGAVPIIVGHLVKPSSAKENTK